MSEAGVRALLERAQSDPAFLERLQSATGREEKRRVVTDAGFDVTSNDMDTLKSLAGIQEISDNDLERIAGGMGTTTAGAASAGGVVVGTIAAIAAAVAIC